MPKTLYKYHAFNVNFLRLLTRAEVYYADPKSFNDPLDCSPTIQIDEDRDRLEKLFLNMLEVVHGSDEAKRRIRDHRNASTQYGNYKTNPDTKHLYMQWLASDIKKLLDDELGKKGIFSLAEQSDCPLMWSHYANKHRGVCIEYE